MALKDLWNSETKLGGLAAGAGFILEAVCQAGLLGGPLCPVAMGLVKALWTVGGATAAHGIVLARPKMGRIPPAS